MPRKKQSSSSVSELHTIDVAKALSGATDAAKKYNDLPPSSRRNPKSPRNAERREQSGTMQFKRRTLPIVAVFAVLVAVATYFLVARFAR